MPGSDFHARRRRLLAERIDRPLLFVGNGLQARNFPANPLPFRQDSTFLYLTGCDRPGAALLLNDKEHTLFLPKPGPADALWHGPTPTLDEIGYSLGIHVAPIDQLKRRVDALNQRPWSLAVSDPQRTALARRLTGLALEYGPLNGPEELVQAIIELRLRLEPEELAAVRRSANATGAAHHAAMAATRPGRTEQQIAALFDGVLAAHGRRPAYKSIVTVRGEVLHNHHHDNTLQDDQLLLLDGGGEGPDGYATDVTRTWPVSGRFTPRQRAVYEAVLAANLDAIERCTPGTRYRDVHLAASRVLARFLVDEGLLAGRVDDLVEAGAHALFFPHGVGHLLGLDVHDMEVFGDLAGYGPDRKRSRQFGLSYLRLDRDLEPGMLVTIEPGLYIVPAILDDDELTGRFKDMVDLEVARDWIGFGGIRIEDDVAITEGAPEVLTAHIAKDPDEVLEIVGTGDLTIPD